MCGTTMEKTARTYFANTEEELRDHLLATLNTHYESATGETFRKIGKLIFILSLKTRLLSSENAKYGTVSVCSKEQSNKLLTIQHGET